MKEMLEHKNSPLLQVSLKAMELVSLHTQKPHPAEQVLKGIVNRTYSHQQAVEEQWKLNGIDCVEYPTTSALIIMYANFTIDKEETLAHIEKFLDLDHRWRMESISNMPRLCVEQSEDQCEFSKRVIEIIEHYIVTGELRNDFHTLTLVKDM
tara:strand:- start:1061 stop:1516 length:456 start_codon:yes stop_codon:yes gene_type:complete